MTTELQRLEEALGRLGIRQLEPHDRRVAPDPAYAQDRERRHLQEDLRRLEAQTQAVGRMIEEARGRYTGRPFRGSGPSRLVDVPLQEPAQHTPRPCEKGTVELNETTVQAQLNAALARLGIHTSKEEEDL